MSANITIIGRLGAEPELRFSKEGMAITSLRVVSSRRKKDADKWIDTDTTWWRVTAFRQLAENVAEHATKGDQIIIVGKARGKEWEDAKTGEKRSAMEIIADDIGLSLAKTRPAERTSANTHDMADDPWATSNNEIAPF